MRGYLDEFQSGNIDLESFYKKRYTKVLSFSLFLLAIALVMEPGISTIYEISVEGVLLHGLLPNNAVEVIDICWTRACFFVLSFIFGIYGVDEKQKACLGSIGYFFMD